MAKARKFTIKRSVTDVGGVSTESTVGTTWLSYSPVRDVEVDLGGSVSRRTKSWSFVAELSTIPLTVGDTLVADSGNLQMKVTVVYDYDNEYKRIDGVADEVKD